MKNKHWKILKTDHCQGYCIVTVSVAQLSRDKRKVYCRTRANIDARVNSEAATGSKEGRSYDIFYHCQTRKKNMISDIFLVQKGVAEISKAWYSQRNEIENLFQNVIISTCQ